MVSTMLNYGTIKKNTGKSGFIQQDSGEPDLFVLPLQCTAFGGVLPELRETWLPQPEVLSYGFSRDLLGFTKDLVVSYLN